MFVACYCFFLALHNVSFAKLSKCIDRYFNTKLMYALTGCPRNERHILILNNNKTVSNKTAALAAFLLKKQ